MSDGKHPEARERMEEKKWQEFVERVNLIPIAVVAAAWLSPRFIFWSQAFGPL
ncbi:MAG: hypothetical protein H8F28_27355, partial [Fibrella sp.]|nr:hypothetical protein [Armatimonadota bacterium]